jgi:hypothetical protein
VQAELNIFEKEDFELNFGDVLSDMLD